MALVHASSLQVQSHPRQNLRATPMIFISPLVSYKHPVSKELADQNSVWFLCLRRFVSCPSYCKRNREKLYTHNKRLDKLQSRMSGIDWIHLAQDRGQWRDVVNMVTNLPVP
jgi:hypothetical protein